MSHMKKKFYKEVRNRYSDICRTREKHVKPSIFKLSKLHFGWEYSIGTSASKHKSDEHLTNVYLTMYIWGVAHCSMFLLFVLYVVIVILTGHGALQSGPRKPGLQVQCPFMGWQVPFKQLHSKLQFGPYLPRGQGNVHFTPVHPKP